MPNDPLKQLASELRGLIKGRADATAAVLQQQLKNSGPAGSQRWLTDLASGAQAAAKSMKPLIDAAEDLGTVLNADAALQRKGGGFGGGGAGKGKDGGGDLGDLMTAAAMTANLFNSSLGQTIIGVKSFGEGIKKAREGEFGAAANAGASALVAFATAAKGAYDTLKGLAASALPQGMKQVDTAFDILAGTIGQVVAPAFVMIGAGALTLAQQIAGILAPNMDSLAQAFADMAGVAVRCVEALTTFAKKTSEQGIGGLATSVGKMGVFGPGGMAAAYLFGKSDDPVSAALDTARNPTGKGVNGEDLLQEFTKNFSDMVADMKQGISATGVGFKGIADAGKQIQTQAFQSNMQQKQLDMFTKMVALLEKISSKVGGPQPAAVAP